MRRPRRSNGVSGTAPALLFIFEAAALAFARPAHAAEPLPQPELIAAPDERAVLKDLAPLLNGRSSPDVLMDALDRALPRLTRPTPFRGFVQFVRASILDRRNQDAQALAPIEESVRLLPGYAGPLLLGTAIYTMADKPGPGADMLLRAIDTDADSVRAIQPYVVTSLLARLSTQRDERRRLLLGERLTQIGWAADDIDQQSTLAYLAIRFRLERGDIAGARSLLPKIGDPETLYRLLISRRYEPIWADAEKWGGEKLGNLWPAYLADRKARWRASQDPEAGADYVRALQSAGHDKELIAEMLPRFSRPLDPFKDYQLLWAVPYLADALAREGRWDDVDRLFETTQLSWPLGRDANALNLAANRARLLIMKGDFTLGLPAMDAAIEDAGRWGGQVGSGPLASMHYYRTCALHALGRDEDAVTSRSIVMSNPGAVSLIKNLYICTGQIEAARATLLAALADPNFADSTVWMVQKSDGITFASDFARGLAEASNHLRHDPALLKGVEPYGRVLPYAMSDGAPPDLQ